MKVRHRYMGPKKAPRKERRNIYSPMAKSITPKREKVYTVGRPSVIDDTVIAKLEEGFIMGFTDREACLYAGISADTLYRYCEKYPYFSTKKELLKESVNLKAKHNLAKDILKENKETSKWWLERKNKAEFALRRDITAEAGGIVMIGNILDMLEGGKEAPKKVESMPIYEQPQE